MKRFVKKADLKERNKQQGILNVTDWPWYIYVKNYINFLPRILTFPSLIARLLFRSLPIICKLARHQVIRQLSNTIFIAVFSLFFSKMSIFNNLIPKVTMIFLSFIFLGVFFYYIFCSFNFVRYKWQSQNELKYKFLWLSINAISDIVIRLRFAWSMWSSNDFITTLLQYFV